MSVFSLLLVVMVGVVVGGSVGYLVWRGLDRSDVDALRGRVEDLERRLNTVESEHTHQKPRP